MRLSCVCLSWTDGRETWLDIRGAVESTRLEWTREWSCAQDVEGREGRGRMVKPGGMGAGRRGPGDSLRADDRRSGTNTHLRHPADSPANPIVPGQTTDPTTAAGLGQKALLAKRFAKAR